METFLPLKIDLQLFSEEKTETATPRKREEVRKKGQVAKSGEIGTALLLLAGFYSIKAFSTYGMTRIGYIVTWFLENADQWDGRSESVFNIFLFVIKESITILLPIFGVLIPVAVISQVIQVGFMFNMTILQPNFNRINPIEGFKRIFSKRAMAEFAKSVFKIVIIGGTVYYHVKAQIPWLARLSQMELAHSAELIKNSIYEIALYIGTTLLILALFDYLFQRWEFEKNIRMTRQEVLEEFKQTEGDPQVRSRIRQKQREMAARRMMAAVPTADVIITNPTHYAIALLYQADTMSAPEVVAKGVGHIALRIKDIANEHLIPTVENPPLAKALYKSVEIGQQIPADLYPAVAEVLAFVYRLKRRSQ